MIEARLSDGRKLSVLESGNEKCPGISIRLVGKDGYLYDLFSVNEVDDAIKLRVWGNIFSEEPTDIREIPLKDIEIAEKE